MKRNNYDCRIIVMAEENEVMMIIIVMMSIMMTIFKIGMTERKLKCYLKNLPHIHFVS